MRPTRSTNNIIWDVRNAEPGTPGQRGAGGSGIFLHASERLIVAQNLIARCDNVGVFPVLRLERQRFTRRQRLNHPVRGQYGSVPRGQGHGSTFKATAPRGAGPSDNLPRPWMRDLNSASPIR